MDPASPEPALSPERWQRVKDAVADALEQAPAERARFLATACGDDPELLREAASMLQHSSDETWIEGAVDDLSWTNQDAAHSRIGQRVGQYRILREIGRGGMGAVYLAERADEQFRKEVAIKILKRGTDTEEVLRRFRYEREILARLEHPNIARLINAGTTEDGLPFFAMEFVSGAPITAYCETRKLSARARLELFLKVCSAVHFAHRNLIVHRDLKPGNILVTAEPESVREEGGEPKLLDFGIAIDPAGSPAPHSRLCLAGTGPGRTDHHRQRCVLVRRAPLRTSDRPAAASVFHVATFCH
jgi:serine/threonine protein kinase